MATSTYRWKDCGYADLIYPQQFSSCTLADLLEEPSKRPRLFFRGYDVLDPEKVGFVSQGAEAERVGFRYDTGVVGNSNGGHLWGTALTGEDKRALIEYLKYASA